MLSFLSPAKKALRECSDETDFDEETRDRL